MSRITDFHKKYLAGLNKYWLVTIVFFAATFLVGEDSFYQRYLYDQKIRSLENEIDYYKKDIEKNKKKLLELQTDRKGLEQFAREEYLMKKEDEDLFIIEE